MSAISTPISAAACFCLKNTPKPAKSFSKRLSFSGEFSCRKSASWGARRRSLCMDMIKGFGLGGRASTTDDGIGGVSGFEQEEFVDDSSLTFEDAGFDATVNNLSKWLISAIFITTLLWRHDAEAVWAALGSALNAMLSVVLKNILNQERPVSTLRSDPGMPSSHAQSIVYTITFLIVSLVERFGVNVLTTTLSGNHAKRHRCYTRFLFCMASDFPTSSHSQPSGCRSYCWIHIRIPVVLVMERFCTRLVHFLPVG